MTNQYGPRTEAANTLHAMKYRGPNEDFREAMGRVAFGLKDSDEHYHSLREILLNMRFLPAGRIQSAIGAARRTTAYNCFVSGTIEDTFVGRDGIMDRAKEAAATMRMGGGIGYDFSTLRPRGSRVAKIDSLASGPVSFMPIYDAVCLATSSYGHRRGAQMAVLRVDHPDIEEFVHAKQNDAALKGFNVSVGVTDAFMEAALAGRDFDLMWEGKAFKTIDAGALWQKIMRSTYDWAEPGILFLDRINDDNNLYYCEKIAATNPCFSGDTLIVTDQGAFPIKDLVGRKSTIHDGEKWIAIDNFRVTGENQRMVKIELQDGSELRVTEKHSMILEDGTRKEAGYLGINDVLRLSDITYDGEVKERGTYLKGFLLGDGAIKSDRATLWVYEPKWCCQDRLTKSSAEIEIGSLNTNVVEDTEFRDVREGVRTMTGLAPKKRPLLEWVTTARKRLPTRVFSWDVIAKREFLAGVFDSDGSAVDGSNGFGYQITSVEHDMLADIQTLLKSIGVRSRLAVGYKARTKIIKDDEYECRELWRLSIGQTGAIKLAQEVKFSRLSSFADKQLKYITNPRMGKVVSVRSDGIEDIVYCCTVPDTHSVALGIGIVTGQCGEQPLPPYGACLLGSFNLTKYLTPVDQHGGYLFDFKQFEDDIPPVVRAMDNVVDRTHYPTEEQRDEAWSKRRMGLGVCGLANAGEALGHPYGTTGFLAFETAVLSTLRDNAYLASAALAKEKGPFAKYDHDKYLTGSFVRKLPPNVLDAIAECGIRNSHLTSIAPTGTISMCADNISSSIEPVFSYSTERPINTPEGQKVVVIEDYGAAFLNVRGKVCADVTAEEHVAVQMAAQPYIDSAISKTINMDSSMPWESFVKIYEMVWRGHGKGVTTFNIDGKRMALLTGVVAADVEDSAPACEIVNGKMNCE